MGYYDEEEIYDYDKHLARYIGAALSEDIESKYNCYTRNRKYECPIIVHVCKLKESERSTLEEGYDEYQLCHDVCEHIYLVDSCCSFKTLKAGVDSVNIKGIFYAELEESCGEFSDYEKEFVYLFFKDANGIDFAKVGSFKNAKLVWSTSQDFEKKFNSRNLDVKIDEYKKLINNRDSYKKSYDKFVKEIEDFKKGLTEEELLAISVVDQ